MTAAENRLLSGDDPAPAGGAGKSRMPIVLACAAVAAAVIIFLFARSNGAKAEVIKSSFQGKAKPVADNATAAGRESNRRVEFVVHFILLNDGVAQ